MALSFHYVHRSQDPSADNFFHRASPSLKLILYVLLNIIFSLLPGAGLLLYCACLLVFTLAVRPRFLCIFREFRAFAVVFLISYISRAHLQGGEEVVLRIHQVSILFPTLFPEGLAVQFFWNSAGAFEALQFILRISAALVSSNIFISTTKITDIQWAVFRIFSLFNRKFAWRLSIMLRLMIASIPLLMDYSERAVQSLRVRAFLPRKHPFRYVKVMGIHMIQAVDHFSSCYAQSVSARGLSLSTLPNGGKRGRAGSTGLSALDWKLLIVFVLSMLPAVGFILYNALAI